MFDICRDFKKDALVFTSIQSFPSGTVVVTARICPKLKLKRKLLNVDSLRKQPAAQYETTLILEEGDRGIA